MKKIIWLLNLMAVSSYAFAINCYFTVLKDTCWKDYQVTVHLIEGNHDKVVAELSVAKSKQWDRVTFDCHNGEIFSLSASFNPPIWQQDKGRVFAGNTILKVPETLPKGYVAWDVRSTFPNDFASIPLPPTATGNCQVDWSQVPDVKLKAD